MLKKVGKPKTLWLVGCVLVGAVPVFSACPDNTAAEIIDASLGDASNNDSVLMDVAHGDQVTSVDTVSSDGGQVHDVNLDTGALDAPMPDTTLGDRASVWDAAGLSCSDDMALIGWMAVCIDRYEASRGDGDVAVSMGGTAPWVEVSWLQASAACEAAGKYLCQGNEWRAACGGIEDQQLPYGPVYEASICNGEENGHGGPLPTGSKPDCEGKVDGVFDMSGNVWEWIAPCWEDSCFIRGGAFDNGPYSLTCRSYDGSHNNEDTAANIGFRCCKEASHN